MDKRLVRIFVPTVCVAALTLLWYKRMMIAMPGDWSAAFLVSCGAGFAICGFALDSMRVVSSASPWAESRRIVVMCSAASAAATLGCLIPAPFGIMGACVSGFAAAAAFLVVMSSGLRALPPIWRGCAFASVFFLAGLVNTSTDLAELPFLRVEGFVPNMVMACLCAAASAAIAGFAGSAFNTRVLAVADSDQKGGAGLARLMMLVIGCFVLMYVAISLKDSVAYPVAVESIVDSGFIRYVELPMWIIAGIMCDRGGRPETVALCTLCAFVGSAGLIAQPGSSAQVLCTLCSYFCLIGFPTVCVCLAIDISYYLPRPAYLGAFCFAPIVIGAAVGEGISRLAASATGDTLFLASNACLALFALLAAFLMRGISSYQGLLSTTPVIELPGDVERLGNNIDDIAKRFSFTKRETEVLELVFQGLTIQQMADELVVSRSTVKFHVTNILKKTGSENRQQMMEKFDV